ncbi:hypothetical protein Desor_1619 [Desulfosporosinus orientis DSM 765]|uniref:Uncharacterized protein n=1 Tax=Desulfosporosinus orientis (strain ATCC 19365 / DSM 765 / NCIMB 8382 / VKM B-1628 / Singapore I) TaxID=768706 RepID=G7WET5_DESOD|nr:hypothetical protein [Desulfosporosinus orientis]AET67264.1 hypothetical protein Desor_1619 [Desulfosporosinus orientis DSM 765]
MKSKGFHCPKHTPIMAALLIPGSGYLFLARPMRGLIMVFWMCIFAYITFQLTTPEISVIGRYSGGIAVWIISVLEVDHMVRKRNQR